MRLVLTVGVNIIDDRLVHVPSNQVHCRERRHRAPRMRSDQVVDKRDPVLRRELRGFVQDLEADSIADERRHVLRHDHLAPEPLREHRNNLLNDRRLSIRPRNYFSTDDHMRWIEKMDTEKIAPERFASVARHPRDRKPRRSGRDDRIGAPVLIYQFEEMFLERQIFRERLENQSRLANRLREVVVVTVPSAIRSPIASARASFCTSARPAPALSRDRASIVT